jgi:hypothetical protein
MLQMARRGADHPGVATDPVHDLLRLIVHASPSLRVVVLCSCGWSEETRSVASAHDAHLAHRHPVAGNEMAVGGIRSRL